MEIFILVRKKKSYSGLVYIYKIQYGIANHMFLSPRQTNGHHSLLQLKILAKVDAIPLSIQKPRRGLPILVHIVVPPLEELEEERCPIDLVVVVDVRNGDNVMNEKTLNLIHKALEFVMEKLTDRDRLAILHDQPSITQSASGLLQMTMEGRHECMKALSFLTKVSKNAQRVRLMLA